MTAADPNAGSEPHPDSRPDPQEAADRRENAADMRRDARMEDRMDSMTIPSFKPRVRRRMTLIEMEVMVTHDELRAQMLTAAIAQTPAFMWWRRRALRTELRVHTYAAARLRLAMDRTKMEKGKVTA